MRWSFWRRTPGRDCEEVRRLMQSFLDGELPAAEAGRVAAHLEDCRPCGIDADTYRRVKQALARLRVPPDPASLARLERFVDDLTVGTDS